VSTPAGPAAGLRLGRVLGVPVFLARSWFLFAAFIVLSYGPVLSEQVGTTRGYTAAASYALLLLASVLLHEIGHCVVARAFDLPVRSITVTLLAGITEITEPPQTPAREYCVAVVGPMVSLLLAGIGLACIPVFEPHTLARLVVTGAAVSNAAVAAFNLLPGLPLDGGRVLKAIAWRLSGDQQRATVVSAWSGRVVAAVVVPLVVLVVLPALGAGRPGLGQILLAALIAAFLYAGATAALRSAQLSRRLPGLSAARLARRAVAVPSDLPLAEALRRAHEAQAYGIVVVDSSGRPESVVNEEAVRATPESRRPWVTVGSLSRHLGPGMVLDPSLAGEQLLQALRATPAGEYLVRGSDGHLGVLATSDVAALLAR
jgi:Zn-dependent protease